MDYAETPLQKSEAWFSLLPKNQKIEGRFFVAAGARHRTGPAVDDIGNIIDFRECVPLSVLPFQTFCDPGDQCSGHLVAERVALLHCLDKGVVPGIGKYRLTMTKGRITCGKLKRCPPTG